MSIIAHNNSTMNEYITHNANGFLIGEGSINLNHHLSVGVEALVTCEEGHRK